MPSSFKHYNLFSSTSISSIFSPCLAPFVSFKPNGAMFIPLSSASDSEEVVHIYPSGRSLNMTSVFEEVLNSGYVIEDSHKGGNAW